MGNAEELSHAAAPSAAGILFQVRRFILRLIDERPDVIMFEVLDDFHTELQNRKVRVEQDKYTTTPKKKMTNESDDIWTTLHNWLAVEELRYRHRESPVSAYCIATNCEDPGEGYLAHTLATDVSPDVKLSHMDKVYKNHQAAARKRKRKPKKSTDGAAGQVDGKRKQTPHIELVMAPQNRDRLLALLGRVSIMFSQSASWTEGSIEDHALAARCLLLRTDENVGAIVGLLHHWIEVRLLDRTPDRKVTIRLHEITELVTTARRATLRPEHSVRPKRAIPDRELHAVAADHLNPDSGIPKFELRLRAVDAPEEVVKRAREAFLQHLAEISYLESRGFIIVHGTPDLPPDDIAYYDDLHERWTTLHGIRVKATTSASSEIKAEGREIYRQTIEHASSAKSPIGEVQVDASYFPTGGYQVLANGKIADREVWWIPHDPDTSLHVTSEANASHERHGK